ncbi:TetR/AcrR family transcriptional regulator [Luteococcus sediminum]|uniref:TetR/AcrR family transcriptional regulator n=1 Tax=Luteococcus sp. TaxID=1969402 RepID=UPI003736D6A5
MTAHTPARTPVRERLLDAADELFFQVGAVATPVDRILAQAGASPASLYAHFGNKDGLLEAALERRLAEWTEVWDAAIEEASDDTGRLLAVFTALRSYQTDRMTERWCAFSGTAATLPHPTEGISRVLQQETQLLRERLVRLATPVGGERSPELAEALMVTYCGTLAMMLRQPWELAIDQGEATARLLVAWVATRERTH